MIPHQHQTMIAAQMSVMIHCARVMLARAAAAARFG